MRLKLFLVGLLGLSAAALLPAPAGEPKESKSALESDPKGWLNLLPGKDLKGWKRVPIPPGGKLSKRDPWSVDPATGHLICDGVGIHEMLLSDNELSDGIFHVAWRFKKLEDKKGYNSGVYVRNSGDGKIWHQAQVGSKNVGFLFGDTPVDGKLKRFRAAGKGPQRGKEAGEWHTYEITCKGKTISLWINGATTAVWEECHVPAGYLGLEAEGYWIEFKDLKWRDMK